MSIKSYTKMENSFENKKKRASSKLSECWVATISSERFLSEKYEKLMKRVCPVPKRATWWVINISRLVNWCCATFYFSKGPQIGNFFPPPKNINQDSARKNLLLKHSWTFPPVRKIIWWNKIKHFCLVWGTLQTFYRRL